MTGLTVVIIYVHLMPKHDFDLIGRWQDIAL